MVAASLKQTKLTILLSINAAAILIAGVLVAGAIFLKEGVEFKVVAEHSDDIGGSVEAPEMLDGASNSEVDLTAAQKAYSASTSRWAEAPGCISARSTSRRARARTTA